MDFRRIQTARFVGAVPPRWVAMTENPRSRDLRKGRVSLDGQVYHVTSRAASGIPFATFDTACALCRTFYPTARGSDVALLAWVVMPDHAHWLLQLGESGDLSKAVAALKRQSASEFNRIKGNATGSSVWQRGFYDRAIRRDEDVAAVARYIVANPLRSGLVTQLSLYPFWDAVWL